MAIDPITGTDSSNSEVDYPQLKGFVVSASNHDLVASGGLISGIGEFVSQTLPLATLNALTSLVNIPYDIANIPYKLATDENIDPSARISFRDDVLAELDYSLGTDLDSYYAQHKTGIDAGGFLLSSLVPGTIGIKALRMGLGSAAKLESGSNMLAALGLGDRAAKTVLNNALTNVARGSPFTYMNKEAFAAYALGAGQGVLDALAFNTAVGMTLFNAPYLENKTAYEIASDAITDSILFGSIFGAVFDTAGKGLGILGYRRAVRPFALEASNLFANAAATSDSIYSAARGNIPSLFGKGVQVTGDVGDDLVLRFRDIFNAKKAATQIEDAISSGRFGDDTSLLNELRQTANDLRARGISRDIDELQGKMRELFKDTEDVVDVRSVVKQMLDSEDINGVASMLSRAKKASLATIEEIENTGKTRARNFILDLRNGSIVSRADEFNAWNLQKKDFNTFQLPDQVFSPEGISGINGSVAYRRAITAGPTATPNNLAELDVAINAVSQGKPFKITYKGKQLSSIEAAEQILREEKIALVNSMVAKGKSPGEIATALHMPEESVLNFNSPAGFSSVADTSLQKARYIKIDYSFGRPMNINKFYLEGLAEVESRAQAFNDKILATIQRDRPDLEKLIDLDTNQFMSGATSGTFKFADPAYNSTFQQAIGTISRMVDTVMRKGLSNRMKQINSALDNILATGPRGLATTEFQAINTWLRQAKNFGKGNAYVIRAGNETWVVRKDIIEETFGRLSGKATADKLQPPTLADAVTELKTSGVLNEAKGIRPDASGVRIKSPEVVAYLDVHRSIDATALKQKNSIRELRGQGIIKTVEDSTGFQYYDPPVDRRTAKHVLVVRGSDAHADPLYQGQMYVVAARSPEELETIRQYARAKGLDAFTKEDTKRFYSALDEYDHSLAFKNGQIKADLQNQGKLVGTIGPESLEDTLHRIRAWHARDEVSLIRNQVAMRYARQFDAMRQVSDITTSEINSFTGTPPRKLAALLSGDTVSEAEKIVNTILNIQTPGPLNAVTRFVDDLGVKFTTGVRDFFSKKVSVKQVGVEVNTGKPIYDVKGITQKELDELDALYSKLGVEDSYAVAMKEAMGTKNYDSEALHKFVRTSNMVLATGQLRLDPLNMLINIIGSPIIGSSTVGLMLKQVYNDLIKVGNLQAAKDLGAAFTVDNPHVGSGFLTFSKMWGNSIKTMGKLASDYKSLAPFNPLPGETKAALFQRIGFTLNPVEALRQESQNAVIQAVNTSGSLAAKQESVLQPFVRFLKSWTKPSDMVESHLQYVAADAGLQIAEIAGLNKTQTANVINTIVQKLQGNFTAAQKPQMFQGITGAAIGMFQSYQARLIHRLVDVIDSGDKKMLTEMLALQSGIFGLRSLPFFEQVNQYLVADSNSDRQDIYSSTFNATDRRIAESMLYGMGSSLLGLNISGRAGATPRIPSTFTTIPAVSLWYEQIKQLKDVFTQAVGGADMGTLFNHAFQHNVVNRPLQQAAQVWAGYSTTSNQRTAINFADNKYVHPDNWLPFDVVNSMRILGSRPLDEAVLMDTVYRWNVFKGMDNEKRAQLDKVLTTKMLGQNKTPLTENDLREFAEEYIKIGGDIEGFNRHIKNLYATTNTDSTERLRKLISNDAQVKQLQIILGRDNVRDKPILPPPTREEEDSQLVN